MIALTKQGFFLRTRVTETAYPSLRLATFVAGLLLTMMSLLTGCGSGDGGEIGNEALAAPVGVTVSLAWDPVPDPSVSAYFVYYGQQSPNRSGSCEYESSMFVDSPSATITNLDPNTHYYFSVSAYNGLESACSNEVATVTPPASGQTDLRNPPPSVQTDLRNPPPSVQTDLR